MLVLDDFQGAPHPENHLTASALTLQTPTRKGTLARALSCGLNNKIGGSPVRAAELL